MKTKVTLLLLLALCLGFQSCSNSEEELSTPKETSNTREVLVKVDVDKMVNFFKGDASYGTKAKPYIADNFVEVDFPDATYSTGSIMQLEPGKEFSLALDDQTQTKSASTENIDVVEDYLEFKMLSDEVHTDEQWRTLWERAFVWNEKTMKIVDGKLYIYEKDGKAFVIKTQKKITLKHNLVYKIFFHVEVPDEDGLTECKYGVIDPYIFPLSFDPD